MKETIQIKNTFRSADVEWLKKSVTEKIENILNAIAKKAI